MALSISMIFPQISAVIPLDLKMATHMLRRFGRGIFVHPFLRRQSIRLVSSTPRVIFAANKYSQQPFLVGSSLLVKPPTHYMGVRLLADAGPALTKDEIQTRVMDVLKLFDKVNPEQVKVALFSYVNISYCKMGLM